MAQRAGRKDGSSDTAALPNGKGGDYISHARKLGVVGRGLLSASSAFAEAEGGDRVDSPPPRPAEAALILDAPAKSENGLG